MLREYMKKSFLDLAYMEEEEARDLIGSIIYDPNGVPRDECPINAEQILKWFDEVENSTTISPLDQLRLAEELDPMICYVINQLSFGGYDLFYFSLRSLVRIERDGNHDLDIAALWPNALYARACAYQILLIDRNTSCIAYHVKSILGCPPIFNEYLRPKPRSRFVTEMGLFPYNLFRDLQRSAMHFYHEDWQTIRYNKANPYRLIFTIVKADRKARKLMKITGKAERLREKIQHIDRKLGLCEQKQRSAKRKSKKLHLFLDKATKYDGNPHKV